MIPLSVLDLAPIVEGSSAAESLQHTLALARATDWHERETYDLVGIRYSSHPYLRRILNPWDWEGHPLRKDYKQLVDALNDKNPHSMR